MGCSPPRPHSVAGSSPSDRRQCIGRLSSPCTPAGSELPAGYRTPGRQAFIGGKEQRFYLCFQRVPFHVLCQPTVTSPERAIPLDTGLEFAYMLLRVIFSRGDKMSAI